MPEPARRRTRRCARDRSPARRARSLRRAPAPLPGSSPSSPAAACAYVSPCSAPPATVCQYPPSAAQRRSTSSSSPRRIITLHSLLIGKSRREHDLRARARQVEAAVQLVPYERAHDREPGACHGAVHPDAFVCDCEHDVTVPPRELDSHSTCTVLECVLQQL